MSCGTTPKTEGQAGVGSSTIVRLREWEAHEIDIPPEEWKAELRKAKAALKAHDEARKILEKREFDLEHSSFYARSRMRSVWPQHYEAAYAEPNSNQ